MPLLLTLLRSRTLGLVASILLALALGFGYYYFYLKPSIEAEKVQELIIKNQEDYIITRKKIDEAISNLSPDADSARERLLKRQAERASER